MKIKFPVLAKTFTYGIVHMTVSFFVAWYVSGHLLVAIGISLIEPAIQIFAYFLHEKAWHVWGKNHPGSAAPDGLGTTSCGHTHHDHKH